jgi:predicted 3-demethylubiquinone-9 3-methyltransferase (glyoxalase superfamily)
MKQIQPFLMFKKNAEEAIALYVNTFPGSKILNTTYWSEQEVKWMEAQFPKDMVPGKAGSVKVVSFELNGQRFDACNGGSPFDFSMGISLYANCESQEEIDRVSEALIANGGDQLDCGWVKDRFGVYWQIVPSLLQEMESSPDKKKAERVSMALYGMKRIDLKKLQDAFNSGEEKRPASAAV